MSEEDFARIHVKSSLSKTWEQERTLNEALYEWMASAPWFAISVAAHVAIGFFIWLLPRQQYSLPAPRVVHATLEQNSSSPFEDPPPPEQPKAVDGPKPLEEALLSEAELSDHNASGDEQPTEASLGESDLRSDSPFEAKSADNDVIGSTARAGGKHGGRSGSHKSLTAANGGVGTEAVLKDGLEWLKRHQSADGSWDCDGFMSNCGPIEAGGSCDGPGESTHDAGITGLALLAFLGDGSTTREGAYKEQVVKAVKWLRDHQDAHSGCYSDRISHSFMYDHAIATLAMCEAYYFSRNPLIKLSAQRAIDFISGARNRYGAWRYDVPPSGQNDTSITGWCVFALASAQESGLSIDAQGFVGARQWFDDVTDPLTGRAGYDRLGSPSSRVPGLNDDYPADRSETLTAVALLSRIFIGGEAAKSPLVHKGAELLKAHPPEWDESGFNNDIYYWYYGSYALFQLGGPRWEAWNKSAKRALLGSQRRDGDAKGSWDPKDAWGHAGGRVYMTAMASLCLEVYFRYSRVLGGR